METSDIQIDKEGIWYFRGAHMFRKEILCVFFEHLKIDDCGRYFIELNDEIYYLDVEDTVFVVTSVFHTTDLGGSHEQIEVLLSDDCREILDPDSLSVGEDNILYCRVKGGRFAARFLRKSYYQLTEFIEEDDHGFHVVLNNRKYFIQQS
jgi:hypothetical protein